MPNPLGVQVLNGGGSVVQGASIYLAVQLTDLTGVYVSDVPYGTAEPVSGPSAAVVITVFTPSNTLFVAQAMTQDSTYLGNYFTTITTTGTAETGLYFAEFNAVNGSTIYPPAAKRPIFRVTTV